jgi:hypothetical protein
VAIRLVLPAKVVLLVARWLAIEHAVRSEGSVVVLVDHEHCRS